MRKIVVIDDEQAICTSLMFALEDEYQVTAITEPRIGIEKVEDIQPDVVLLDMRIKDVDGLSLIEPILSVQPNAIIIVMTAYGTIETSVEALKRGAFHYLTKPINIDELKILIRKGLDYHCLNEKVEKLEAIIHPKDSYAGMIGKSPMMKQLFSLIERIKNIPSHVLITGESGTGKELVARALHYEGLRSSYPYSVLNCAAIPESLLESELFGHEKGSFTGAITAKEGIFERTDKGTLFLDEIGEMSLNLQVKLLRVIQEGEITPVGSGKVKKVDVRIIAATNRDLFEEVKNGKFREDLFYRLNVIPIQLQPLRSRMEDVPLLVEHFISLYSKKLNRSALELSHQAKKWLFSYEYPGNIRELSNIIEYAVALSDDDVIQLEDLPLSQVKQLTSSSMELGSDMIVIRPGISLAEAEKEIILHTLKQNENHRKNTADILGISERTLREKLKQYSVASLL
ncbi:sigma-54-dependent transcriptional regulator [Calidifontibacillus oryziterrae]|uniref:sigma-54-dependent transcriptional regulator n=1 Tax=Calidifontibacillus oryziterrae TaxID=1191699 RepID=UPI0002D744E1|nr:sigma-54 dependent transcriptional regulator [Calidifontibacillus oryziterrae]